MRVFLLQTESILFVLFTLCCCFANAQDHINYLSLKQSQKVYSCTKHDIESVNITIRNLQSLDTSAIVIGLSDYFYDLGMAYFIKEGLIKQKGSYEQAIIHFERSLQLDKKRGAAYNNLAIIYYFRDEFDKAKTQIKLYKKFTPKKYRDKEIIDLIENL